MPVYKNNIYTLWPLKFSCSGNGHFVSRISNTIQATTASNEEAQKERWVFKLLVRAHITVNFNHPIIHYS